MVTICSNPGLQISALAAEISIIVKVELNEHHLRLYATSKNSIITTARSRFSEMRVVGGTNWIRASTKTSHLQVIISAPVAQISMILNVELIEHGLRL